jgi:hypothetical protein
MPKCPYLKRKTLGIFGPFLCGAETPNRLLIEADVMSCRKEAVWARCPNYEAAKKK